ncbi:hypothetical protein [Achromobacter sp. ACM05]|uniref:hypothetical protein n=1 Tax=Achromobacter sp. ACM05 TaxID=2854776 RepID=UPI001C453EA3|nr:hypothetical protein [Achromobacter sp. ACM05]MBV7501725.1 hypothetical protein [Achromobacter sp. ACM05]
MLMILIFPLVFVGVLTIWLACVVKGRSVKRAPPALTVTFLALVLCYAMGLIVISLDPWFDDNGVPEFISWKYRWAWAASIAGWLAIVVLPAVLGLRAAFLSRARKQFPLA